MSAKNTQFQVDVGWSIQPLKRLTNSMQQGARVAIEEGVIEMLAKRTVDAFCGFFEKTGGCHADALQYVEEVSVLAIYRLTGGRGGEFEFEDKIHQRVRHRIIEMRAANDRE